MLPGKGCGAAGRAPGRDALLGKSCCAACRRRVASARIWRSGAALPALRTDLAAGREEVSGAAGASRGRHDYITGDTAFIYQ